jgi:hypothetical protein
LLDYMLSFPRTKEELITQIFLSSTAASLAEDDNPWTSLDISP